MNDQALVDLYYPGKSISSINPAHLAGLRRVAARAWEEGGDILGRHVLKEAGAIVGPPLTNPYLETS